MRALLITGILALCLTATAPAAAQPMGARTADAAGIDVSEQMENASNALEEALKTWVTKGESTRGATGAVGELLLNSDKLICSGWMIAFYTAMNHMSGAALSDEGAAVLQAMNRLKSAVEAACEKALNGPRRRLNTTGGGGEEGAESTTELQPNTCPDCPYEQQALEAAQWRLEGAQFRAERARGHVADVTRQWLANPQAMRQLGAETVEEAEREEERRSEDVRKALDALGIAERALERCKEMCRKQASFFDSNRNKLLVAAAAVAVTTVAMVGGGTPTTLVSTPPAPQPVANTPPPQPTTPVVTAPTPPPAPAAPTLASLIVGRWICAACRALNDPDRHENTLRFCVQLVALFQMLANSPLRIEHPAPWVTVSGELDDATGAYRATGMGSVSGFSNVSSTVTATFQRTGDTVTAVDLTVTLGENGVFPGGRPVSYAIRLTKNP